MYIDAQLLLSDAQALTATGASTNIIDLGADRNVGIGEPLAVVITCDAALAGTSPTFQATIQADDNSGFASPGSVASGLTYSALAAGEKVVLPIPPDASSERFIRLNYTLGGTAPTVTVTAFVIPLSCIQNNQVFADAITIS